MTRKPFQSKLLPHVEFIRECRAQHISYPRIAADLHARFGLTAAPSTIFAFVKVRSRRRNAIALLAPASIPVSAAPAPRAQPAPTPATATQPGARPGWLFYDPTKPLVKDAS